MTFKELLGLVSSGSAPHIRVDSRLVKAGDIFVAIEGTTYNGRDFIDQAIANGVKYIVCQQRKPCCETLKTNCEIITVDDSAKAAAILAQASRGNPASKLINLAVTGTNGKTTVAFLVKSVIQNAGEKCGLIGTIIYDTGAATYPASLTTPDSLEIADKQQQMLRAGAKYMVIEASSHSLSQDRLAGINFKAAAFTNLTGDHLDYHKTEENYLAAKMRLFEGLSADSTAILNKDSPHSTKIALKTKARILWYAIDAKAQLNAHIESMDMTGTVSVLEYAGLKQKVATSLLGRHNVSNLLAAAGLCLGCGFGLDAIAAGLSKAKTVPGRLEPVDCGQNFSVLIDYAHTDDALKNVLSTLKPLCKGKLTVVFGCGGDRDRTKRPRMARVVEQLADFVIVTSDNPRTEAPETIIGEIFTGFEKPTADKITHEVDRKKAIKLAIENASADDIVLIAGKGHETYQIIGKQKFDFDDKTVVKEYLERRIRDGEL